MTKRRVVRQRKPTSWQVADMLTEFFDGHAPCCWLTVVDVMRFTQFNPGDICPCSRCGQRMQFVGPGRWAFVDWDDENQRVRKKTPASAGVDGSQG